MTRFASTTILILFAAGNALAAEGPTIRHLREAIADPSVMGALGELDGLAERMGAKLAAIGAIQSPSGREHERAAAVAARMRSIGLSDVTLDDTPNAVGLIPGRSGHVLVFISTLDDLETVAEHQRRADGPPRVEGDRVVGPGVNTSATTIAMLGAAETFLKSGLEPEHDLVFAAVAQEETGMTGMKKVYRDYRGRAIGFVDILGDGRSVTYGALGIHWWKVIASGPPGHSLGGGLPNVNQGIGRAVPAMFLSLARQFIFLLPATLVLSRLFGMNGLWAAVPASDGLTVILSLAWTILTFRRLGVPLLRGPRPASGQTSR